MILRQAQDSELVELSNYESSNTSPATHRSFQTAIRTGGNTSSKKIAEQIDHVVGCHRVAAVGIAYAQGTRSRSSPEKIADQVNHVTCFNRTTPVAVSAEAGGVRLAAENIRSPGVLASGVIQVRSHDHLIVAVIVHISRSGDREAQAVGRGLSIKGAEQGTGFTAKDIRSPGVRAVGVMQVCSHDQVVIAVIVYVSRPGDRVAEEILRGLAREAIE